MRFLLVEDNAQLAKAVADRLTLDGHVVDSAGDLGTADDFTATTDYDLILLDIMLPDGDGRDFLKAHRAREGKTPVIVLTARSEVSDRVGVLDLGADDYITKPYSVNELLARVRANLRRVRPARAGQVLAVKELTTDQGPELGNWRAGVAHTTYSHKNFLKIPQAHESEEMRNHLAMNRGTENNMTVFTFEGVIGYEVAAPGQSAFIAPDGTRSPHFDDQLELFGKLGKKRTWLSPDDVETNSADTTTLSY